jgi:predicted Fe-S protein YdhL (DUF1289 family)
MKKGKKSPCVDVCNYRGPKGWCLACGLTSKESKDWKRLKPYARSVLLKKLKQRQLELARVALPGVDRNQ